MDLEETESEIADWTVANYYEEYNESLGFHKGGVFCWLR
jgi:hypothetical protein